MVPMVTGGGGIAMATGTWGPQEPRQRGDGNHGNRDVLDHWK